MRPGEREGIDYHFVDDAEFDLMVENDDFGATLRRYTWTDMVDRIVAVAS